MGICSMTQGTQTEAVWQPREVGWEGRWEGSWRGMGHIYILMAKFISMFGRNQHNSVKQLSFN